MPPIQNKTKKIMVWGPLKKLLGTQKLVELYKTQVKKYNMNAAQKICNFYKKFNYLPPKIMKKKRPTPLFPPLKHKWGGSVKVWGVMKKDHQMGCPQIRKKQEKMKNKKNKQKKAEWKKKNLKYKVKVGFYLTKINSVKKGLKNTKKVYWKRPNFKLLLLGKHTKRSRIGKKFLKNWFPPKKIEKKINSPPPPKTEMKKKFIFQLIFVKMKKNLRKIRPPP